MVKLHGLEDGHLDEVLDVKMLPGMAASRALYATTARAPIRAASSLELQGILWGNPPAAIINNQTVFPNDQFKVNIDGKETQVRCLEIQTNFVRVKNLGSGQEQQLRLWDN